MPSAAATQGFDRSCRLTSTTAPGRRAQKTTEPTAAVDKSSEWRVPALQARADAHSSLDWRVRRTPSPSPSVSKFAKCWCFFDVETTGQSLRHNFVCALGLAIVALGEGSREPVLLTSKKWFIRPPDPHRQWDPYTLREFWLHPKRRAFYERVCHKLDSPSGVDARVAMSEFVAICCHTAKNRADEATLLSDTSGFDFSWLYYYLSHFGPADCSSPSHLFGSYKPVRDITSYFAGVSGSMHARYPHRWAMRAAGLDEREWHRFARRVRCPQYDHDPEHDAVHIALRSAWIAWRLEQQPQRTVADDATGSPATRRLRLSSQMARSDAQYDRPEPLSAPPRLQHTSGSDRRSSTDLSEQNVEHDGLRMAFVIRTDLRMRRNKIAAHCAKSALAAIARLASIDASDSDCSDDVHCSDEDDCDDNRTFDLLRRVDRMQRYRAPDAATLHRVRDAARHGKLNYHLLHDERSNAPTVLAVGPASAASLQSVLCGLKAL